MVVQSFEALKRWAPEDPDVNLSRDVARLQPKLFDLLDRVRQMDPKYMHRLQSNETSVQGFTVRFTDGKYPQSDISVSIGYRDQAPLRSKEFTIYEVRVLSSDYKRLNHIFEHFVIWPRRIAHGIRLYPLTQIRDIELTTLKKSDKEVQHLKNLVRDVKKFLDAGHLPVKAISHGDEITT